MICLIAILLHHLLAPFHGQPRAIPADSLRHRLPSAQMNVAVTWQWNVVTRLARHALALNVKLGHHIAGVLCRSNGKSARQGGVLRLRECSHKLGPDG